MKSIYDASVKELKHLTDLLKSRLSRGSITPTEYEQLEYAEAKVLTNQSSNLSFVKTAEWTRVCFFDTDDFEDFQAMLKHFCNPVNYVVRNSSEDYTYYYPFVNNGEIMCYLKIETLTPLVLDLRDFRIALEKVTTFNGEDFLSQYYKLQKRTLDLRIKEGDCICRTNITDEFTVTSIEDVSTTWVKLVTKYNLRYPKLRTAPNVKKFCAITDDEGKSYLGRISFNNVGKGTPAMCMELNVYREISDILEKYNVSDIESLSIYELEDYISNKGTMMTWYRDRDRTSIWFKHTPLDRIYLVTLGLYADKLLDDLQDIFCGYKIEKFLNIRG